VSTIKIPARTYFNKPKEYCNFLQLGFGLYLAGTNSKNPVYGAKINKAGH